MPNIPNPVKLSVDRAMIKKISATGFALVAFITSPAHANSSFRSICAGDGGTYLEHVYIEKYAATNTWLTAGSGSPAFHVLINDAWYGISSADLVRGGGALGIQQYALALANLGEPVNVCVKPGVLRGVMNAAGYAPE